MLVKCPRCGAIIDARAGSVASCRDCGFRANVAAEPPPAVDGPVAVSPPATAPRGTTDMLGPVAVLSSLVGAGTFYLAAFWFPFVFSAAGAVAGLVAHRTRRDAPRGLAAIVIGAVGIVLGVVTLLLP